LLLSPPVWAQTVVNAGFEEPVIADGAFNDTGGPGWDVGYYDVANPTTWVPGGGNGGVWNPDAASGFTAGAFAGENVAWAASSAGIDAGLSQTLAATLEANTVYVLSVQVGNPFYNESDTTAPYRLELWAGDALVASDTGNPPAADLWEAQSLTFTSGPEPEQLAQPLTIRLIAVDYTDGGGFDGYEVDFDEVSVTIEPPAPCDTHCDGVALSLIESETANVRAEASATDDSEGGIRYVFTVENAEGVVLALDPQAEASAEFDLPPGDYSITVVVSDDSSCGPAAEDSSCSETITVPPLGGAQLPGDCNQDGMLDISDASCIFGVLFLGNPPALPCGDGNSSDPANLALVDWQADGQVDISDGIAALEFVLCGGGAHALGSECLRIVGCEEDTCTP